MCEPPSPTFVTSFMNAPLARSMKLTSFELFLWQKVSSLVKNENARNDDVGKTSRDNCCSVCGKKFKAQIDFVLHYSKTHLNKNFPCPVSNDKLNIIFNLSVAS